MKNLVFCFIILSSTMCKSASCDKYDFGFENLETYSAKWLKVENNAVSGGDTIDFVEGRSSFCFIRPYNFVPFYSSIFQTIVLPRLRNNIEISIHSKSQNILDCYLKVICLNWDEKIIKIDSMCLESKGEWKKFKLKLATSGTSRIYIEISANSNQISKMKIDKDSAPKLNVDNLILKLDNIDIDSIGIIEINPANKNTERLNIIALNDLAKTEDLKNHSIVAFGESVHGSREAQEQILNAIIEQIKTNNCKLVLMEFPYEVGLRINQIIQDKSKEKIEDLLLFNNLDFPSFNFFIRWLTEYNKTAAKNVTVMGLDEKKKGEPEDYLKIFMKDLFKDELAVNDIMSRIYNNDFNGAMRELERIPMIHNVDLKTQASILHAIKMRVNYFKPGINLVEGNREYLFFKNAEFAINTYIEDGEKTAIFAHLDHVNKKNAFANRYQTRNFGNYMDENYGQDYFVIGVLLGKGTITSFGKDGYNLNAKLKTPVPGSSEYCFDQENEFYLNVSNLNSFGTVRLIGAAILDKQFYSYSHKERMDGAIYIKNSTSNRLPESWPKTIHEIKEYLKPKSY